MDINEITQLTQLTQQEITRRGDPSNPKGEEGAIMLSRMNNSHAELTQWALSHISIEKDGKALDIGCGGGAALKRLSSVMPRGKLFGIDHSEVAVRSATENNSADIASGKMKVIRASVSDMPFDSGYFDLIITVESFYFWRSPIEELAQVRRVLKKGGAFLLVLDVYQKDGLSQETKENVKQYDMFLPTPEQLEDMLAKAGFSNVCIHTKQGTDRICAVAML